MHLKQITLPTCDAQQLPKLRAATAISLLGYTVAVFALHTHRLPTGRTLRRAAPCGARTHGNHHHTAIKCDQPWPKRDPSPGICLARPPVSVRWHRIQLPTLFATFDWLILVAVATHRSRRGWRERLPGGVSFATRAVCARPAATANAAILVSANNSSQWPAFHHHV